MTYSWSVNIHDPDGDVVEKCILIHAGNDAILKFKNAKQLEVFARDILRSLAVMKQTNPDA